MVQHILPLVKWENGVIMIGVFVLVVIALVVALILFMNSEKKDSDRI